MEAPVAVASDPVLEELTSLRRKNEDLEKAAEKLQRRSTTIKRLMIVVASMVVLCALMVSHSRRPFYHGPAISPNTDNGAEAISLISSLTQDIKKLTGEKEALVESMEGSNKRATALITGLTQDVERLTGEKKALAESIEVLNDPFVLEADSNEIPTGVVPSKKALTNWARFKTLVKWLAVLCGAAAIFLVGAAWKEWDYPEVLFPVGLFGSFVFVPLWLVMWIGSRWSLC